MGELALPKTRMCQLNGYTCTFGDDPNCCDGREEETRKCIPCDETIYKKPQGSKYTKAGNCEFKKAIGTQIIISKYTLFSRNL